MKVGLIAHDSKKKLMQNLCIAYRGILSRHELYATGTTGTLVEEVTNLRIHMQKQKNQRSARFFDFVIFTIFLLLRILQPQSF